MDLTPLIQARRHQDPPRRDGRPRRLRRRRARHRARRGERRRTSTSSPRGHHRARRAGRPRHHPRLGPGPPRAVRLRPRAVRARARRAARPPVSTSSCAPATSPPAATSPRSTPTARSPTGGPGASPTPRRAWSSTARRPACRCRGVEVFFRHEREHRVLVVLRGDGLDPHLTDTDPQQTGVPPLAAEPLDPEAKRTAELLAELDAQVRACSPTSPRRTSSCCAASTPTASSPASPSATVCAPRRSRSTRCTAASPACSAWTCSVAPPTSTSSSTSCATVGRLRLLLPPPQVHRLRRRGRRPRPQDRRRSKQLDAVVPQLRELVPDVIAVSGDHSTPTQMAAHSWHPVPALLWSERCGRDDVEQFGERWCASGRARPPAHQGPDGDHARQRRPPAEVRRVADRTSRSGVMNPRYRGSATPEHRERVRRV